ncbi:hypothetical protein LMG26858_06242 [Achromobacter anxifer]|uniref:Uncharacterized protein n=1 Tax=Achromobacter anxifer TaxID=1287737 RepID=A0A6S7F2M5_9BURK|nr:hypothetical protein LMG26858_06242 [Achromobacter anxifer]
MPEAEAPVADPAAGVARADACDAAPLALEMAPAVSVSA